LQQAFAREYLVDYNGTQAARRAGYGRKGARVAASKNLKIPKVRAELARLAAPITDRTLRQAADCLKSVCAVAFGDIRELFKPSPENPDVSTLKDIGELSAHQQVLIRSYCKRTDGTFTVTFEDRTRAKELLMKHLGLLKDRMRLDGASGLTLDEEEKISRFSDEELKEFREANETVERLLHPEPETSVA